MSGTQVNCGYCLGERSPCDCAEDCGARPDGIYNCHVCPEASPEVVAEWLRSTGLYSEDEITRRTGGGTDGRT